MDAHQPVPVSCLGFLLALREPLSGKEEADCSRKFRGLRDQRPERFVEKILFSLSIVDSVGSRCPIERT